jgi:prephenate dehydratase
MAKAAFQGEPGAFSEDAILSFFKYIETVPCVSYRNVFEAVANDSAEFGTVPVENSQAGSINEAYDLLLEYPVNIFREVIMRINHCLLALPGDTLSDIEKVYSHPMAIAQCTDFFNRTKIEVLPDYNTAVSAKRVKEEGVHGRAAIASKRSAQIYGLDIVAENIETSVRNYTKFFIISKKIAERAAKNKTSVVFSTKNMTGALYNVLGIFATRTMNLTKLESRPRGNQPWDYNFYLDFEGHFKDKICQEALGELKDKTDFLKILGSYPFPEP